jgi:hypothetical protein
MRYAVFLNPAAPAPSIPLRARPPWRGVAAAFAGLALACLPTNDLSGYSTDVGLRPTMDAPASSPTPSPVAAMPAEMSGGGTSEPDPVTDPARDGLPGEGAPLEPANEPIVVAPPDDDPPEACVADCGPSDAGTVAPPEPIVDAAPVIPSCTVDETIGPRGFCYIAITEPLGWDAARANCRARGAGWDLASIRSGNESAFARALIVDEVWIGGSDGLLEGTWAWVDDSFEFWQGDGDSGLALNGAFVNWFEDEPNGDDSSDCMRVLVDARWADLECGETRPSICQGPSR